jgi:hypothetical protein
VTDHNRMIWVSITGDGIYQTLYMPEVPRKGDILWLHSLTLGVAPEVEVVVSKVEWARDQTQAFTSPLDGIYPRLTVRRTHYEVERARKAKES